MDFSSNGYAELQVTTNFSFLQGASHPDELVRTAKELGHIAIGIADRNSLAGVVRAHVAAKEVGLKLLVGARLDFADGTPSMLCYPKNREAYGRLAHMLTVGKRRAPKGQCELFWGDLQRFREGQTLIILSGRDVPDLDLGDTSIYMGVQFLFDGQDAQRLHQTAALAKRFNLPLVATNDVHAHHENRRRLQDILTCIREHCTIETAGFKLHQNAERHLKSPAEMTRLFADYPQAIHNTVKIAAGCNFSLDELRYEYPPIGDQQDLEKLTWQGARERYPEGVPKKVSAQIAHELKLVEELNYAPYFLTVHDIVSFAKHKGILYQGRGSAANSVICYCIGITAVDPTHIDLLFERFVSKDRNEPPDIDVDFEHERREEVIQYIYQRYGRDRAGIAATLITYRKRSAVREVGKALGFSLQEIEGVIEKLKGRSLNDDDNMGLWFSLAKELLSFPRHLGQHVGGFVLTKGLLCESVPIGNAAMQDRTYIEWDKDDLDALGMLKVDVLGLGMLSCIRRSFDLLKEHYGKDFTLANVPRDDSKTYDMICKADTIGVFQIESRAQMSMLPRLKPRCYYDLVIEVAIVRPGPIQGNMVHPYLRRRNGEEPVSFPSKALEEVLGKTMGVPLFQEQAMKMAVVAANFTPGEADQLRRAMATFKRSGLLHRFEDKFIQGMVTNGYELEFAQRCYKQILGFGEYGFPESHAASFAHLVYISAWLKCHYPEVFTCALLNSLPMGFYAPAQIIADAQRHGVKTLPPDVNHSLWDYTLTPQGIRTGLREIQGLRQDEAEWIVACRGHRYRSLTDLVRRSGILRATVDCLTRADALGSLGLDRQYGAWESQAVEFKELPLLGGATQIPQHQILPHLTQLEEVVRDYRSVGFTLRKHPLGFLREGLDKAGFTKHAELKNIGSGQRVKIAGMVLVRQRPPTAKGVVFQTLEDETGLANIVIWADLVKQFHQEVFNAGVLAVYGKLEQKDGVIHVIAQKLIDYSSKLEGLYPQSRDFK